MSIPRGSTDLSEHADHAALDPATIRAVVLDIEGTISPISYVHDVMFPLARREMAGFLRENWSDEEVTAARMLVELDARHGDLELSDMTEYLGALMDRDAKATGLKAMQGLIWRRAFAAGTLRAPVYADVPIAIRRWRGAGRSVSIYSSGSSAAQRAFLTHSDQGDLTPLIREFFDTTVGPKQAPESYREISRRLETPPEQILFISDMPAELDAAVSVGMDVRLAVRPGNAAAVDASHVVVRTFDDVR
ncbi:MAG: acireductone synthase [Phycisphaerae bacterium]